MANSTRKRAMILTAAATVSLLANSACSGGSAEPADAGSSETASIVITGPTALGTILTDNSGRTLYMFASDSDGTSTCSGACATVWPPLTSSAAPTAGGDASSSKVGTITREDGSAQVTYAGHPLYYYQADTSPGDVKGEGSDGFGAKWWVLDSSGQPITDSASSAPAGSGYDY